MYKKSFLYNLQKYYVIQAVQISIGVVGHPRLAFTPYVYYNLKHNNITFNIDWK